MQMEGAIKAGNCSRKQDRGFFAPSCWGHQVCLWQYCYIFAELINWESRLVLGDYLKEYKYACKIAESATSLIGWLNNHGKVWKMFGNTQAWISQHWTGQRTVLAYLVANLTRWTTHCVAFIRLLQVQSALKLKVMRRQSGLNKAQVGAATSTEWLHLMEDAENYCDLIADHTFWEGLEHTVADIEQFVMAQILIKRTQLAQIKFFDFGWYVSSF
jgi:hypothetical protein